MNHEDVGRLWDANAEAWAQLGGTIVGDAQVVAYCLHVRARKPAVDGASPR